MNVATTLYSFRYRNPANTSQLGPVYALAADGRGWVQSRAMAYRLGVNLDETHMLYATDFMFATRIIGAAPSASALQTSDLGGYAADGDPDAGLYQ